MAGMRVSVAAMLAGCGLCLLAQDTLPEGKGKVTLESTCTECHGLDKVLAELRTPAAWREIAARMRSKGASMTDAEFDDLLEYLSLNFAKPDAKPEKVNVNKASAADLQTALELSGAAAAAIVRYREAHGPFKDWRQLAKVEGVESAKIEAQKDRLIF